MKVHFLTENALEALRVNLSGNLKHYADKNNDWIYNYFGEETPFIEYKQEFPEFKLSFNSEEDIGKIDVNNTITLYSAMKSLTDTQATDERLWSGMCHCDFWDFLQERWQVKDYHNMIERSTFYIAGLYHTGLKRGEAYEKNNKVIGINILMFNIFDWKKFHSKGLLKENELNKVMTDKLELHFLELPKLIKNKEEGNKRLRQWLEFIYNKRKGEIEIAVQENEKIAKAQVEYKYLTGDEQVQRLAF